MASVDQQSIVYDRFGAELRKSGWSPPGTEPEVYPDPPPAKRMSRAARSLSAGGSEVEGAGEDGVDLAADADRVVDVEVEARGAVDLEALLDDEPALDAEGAKVRRERGVGAPGRPGLRAARSKGISMRAAKSASSL